MKKRLEVHIYNLFPNSECIPSRYTAFCILKAFNFAFVTLSQDKNIPCCLSIKENIHIIKAFCAIYILFELRNKPIIVNIFVNLL